MSDRGGLIGRSAEREQAWAAAREAAAGAGGVLTVAGEPGVGKTMLVRTLAGEWQRDLGARVLWGECYEGSPQTPFGPWEAVFAPLDGLAVPAGHEVSAPDARLGLFAAALTALGTARADGPLVVVVDDLHWASPDSLELFGFVAARAGPAGLLLVGTYRDPDPGVEAPAFTRLLGGIVRLPAATHLDLTGLSVEQVGAYLRDRLGDGVPMAVVNAVHEHTGGNPFFVREVAAALVKDGTLVQRAGRWTTDVSVPALGIPPTVRHVVRARMEAVSTAARSMLEAASAFPSGFDLDVVAAVSGIGEGEALDAIDEAIAHGFVRRAEPPAPPYAFAHAIVGDAIADARSPDRSARVHRRAAEVLTELRPHVPAAALEQWWRSRSLAGADAGIQAGLAAADTATASHAYRQAAHFLELTLDLVPEGDRGTRADVLARLARAAASALDADLAPSAVRRALPLLDPIAGAALVVDVSDALREGAPATSWQPLVTAALASLPGPSPAGGPAGAAGLTWARLATCLDPVETVAAGALRVGRWTGYPPEAIALLASSSLEADQARAVEPFRPRTLAETQRLVAVARRWSDAKARIRVLDFAGRDYIFRHGHPHDAIDCYNELLDVGRSVGSFAAEAEACAQLGLCLGLVGDLDEARVMMERARRLVDDLWPEHRLHLLGTFSTAVIVGYETGSAAWDELAAGIGSWLGHRFAGAAPWTIVFGALCGLVEAMGGQPEAARSHLADVAGAVALLEPHDHAVAGSLWFATAGAWQLGDAGLADRLAPLLDRHLDAGGPPGPFGSLAQASGRVAVLRADADAGGWWPQARTDTEASGCRPVRLLIDYDEASAEGDRARIVALAPTLAAAGLDGWAARAAAGSPSGGIPTAELPAGLTRRELEVLALVAGGLTNKEIAARLVLSLLTVNRHVANIYAKIGARNRAEATAFALSRHLVAKP